MKHVVMFSGGVSSWGAAKRAAEQYGTDDLTLLFADTKMEDADLYRFLREAAADIGGQLVTIEDGRTPWQVFQDVRFLGNTRIDPCSRILKRELMRKWLENNCDPANTTVYLGFDWTEFHRIDRAAKHWHPWTVRNPLAEPPEITKQTLVETVRAHGIEPPRLYAMGFAHNNCGGFCIKAGQAQFALLLKQLPCVYQTHERFEQGFRTAIGKDVSILRDRTGGTTKPLTLQQFRERIENGGQYDAFDWGGCSCMDDNLGDGRKEGE